MKKLGLEKAIVGILGENVVLSLGTVTVSDVDDAHPEGFLIYKPVAS
jgi:hypothetical protein